VTPLYRSIKPIIHTLDGSERVREALKKKRDLTTITNLPPSLDALLAADLFTSTHRPLFILAEDAEAAERLYDDLARLLEEDSLALFSEGAHASLLAKERQKRTQSAEATAQLLEAIDRLARTEVPLITIADAESVSCPLPGREDFARESLTLKKDTDAGFEELKKWLNDHHFEMRQFVESAGDFAVRGGIIDVFPYTETAPVRIEFFGDTIESMRAFDAISQRSIIERAELTLVPNALTDEAELKSSTIFSYLPQETIAIEIEPDRIDAKLEEEGLDAAWLNPMKELQRIVITAFPTPGSDPIDFGAKTQPSFNANLKLIRQHINGLLSAGINVLVTAESKDLAKRIQDLIDVGEEGHPSDHDLAEVAAPLPIDGLQAIDELLDASRNDGEKLPPGIIQYITPSIAKGFVLPISSRHVVYTEHELFGRRRDRGASAKKRAARTKGISLRELRSLKRGDLLVHEDKGIGKFMGLETIEVRGAKQEVVRLVYRDNDVLFVNLDYIHKLSRYSAGEAPTMPNLSKLGSPEWQRTKERTKKKLKDIARNLINLYAKRKRMEGFAFSSDDILQKEMEAAFIYEDTPDQEKATIDFKKDMESRSPMDRLVCGDVGFGKTEVAMRAVMKCVLDKKQAAVLVPTTILAEQHHRSFSDRLERFGVKVAALSRFRSKKEQTEILKQLSEGTIDVLIGTHRLLSKDVVFKDLGLLVIDEEHRFGVGAKEKLRELRANIDTLTLTATPIPRTLNFSLLGARDLSIMETPPKNRLPVVTEVLPGWNDDAIAEAVKKEMTRGGQTYVINDKVGDIDNLTNKLRELVPRLRAGVIHGQMPPTSIEKVMRDFLERKIDVLVATKIVESGLDVPNANTIIINRAQNFGLAELYQLRGRVGRSNEQAYCYLISPPLGALSKDALRRMEAMEEFSDLGAGFQLAMRDLEIRGAGNLLGAEQSGFIGDIGFELYQKVLEEAVEELKQEEFQELFKDELATAKKTAFGRKRLEGSQDVNVSLGIDALIPAEYIEDDAERFRFYQRMASATIDAELDEIAEEMRDRFGPLPEEAQALTHVARIRERAKKFGARAIQLDDATRTVRILMPSQEETHYYKTTFPLILDQFPVVGANNVRLAQEGKTLRLVVRLHTKEMGEPRLLEIEEVIHKLTPPSLLQAEEQLAEASM
jgi:transcription-repair coupling factor (superfamily II helicase)